MASPDVFNQHRPALFGLAYRMLSSVTDAEDIVQEAFLRWQRAREPDIRSPRAYLMTIVTRLCLDQLRLAHVQREAYTGVWLPEPLLQSPENDPARLAEVNASISTAFLLLLETLSPLDRAVFLLHEVFGYTFAEIATIVDRNPADCRQIGYRARQRVKQGRPRFEVESERVEAVVQQFLDACTGGDLSELLALLSPDVTVSIDSGGKVSAIRNTVAGADKVARLFLGIFRKWAPPLSFQIATVNGQRAWIGYIDEEPVGVITFDVRDGRIQAIYQVLNPDKLKGVAGAADWRADARGDDSRNGQ